MHEYVPAKLTITSVRQKFTLNSRLQKAPSGQPRIKSRSAVRVASAGRSSITHFVIAIAKRLPGSKIERAHLCRSFHVQCRIQGKGLCQLRLKKRALRQGCNTCIEWKRTATFDLKGQCMPFALLLHRYNCNGFMLTALRFGGGVALNGHRTATFDLKGQPARSPDFFIEQLPHVYVAALQSQKSAFFLPGFKQHHLVHLARNNSVVKL